MGTDCVHGYSQSSIGGGYTVLEGQCREYLGKNFALQNQHLLFDYRGTLRAIGSSPEFVLIKDLLWTESVRRTKRRFRSGE